MDNRKPILRIGLLLTGGYNWVGGLYYVINIIKVLKNTDEAENIEIIVFYSNNTAELDLEISTPCLSISSPLVLEL